VIDSYNQALKISPKDAKIHSYRGIAFNEEEYLKSAISSYKQAVMIEPSYSND